MHSKLCDLCVSQQIFLKTEYKAIPVVLGVFKVLSFCLECSYKPLELPNPKKSSVAVFLQ